MRATKAPARLAIAWRTAIALVLSAPMLMLATPVKTESNGAPDLYEAVAVVTGTGEKNRILGYVLCLEEVLSKVSGNVEFIGDPRLRTIAKHAAPLVEQYAYLDLYAGRPLNDEQGSYDRPHYLTVRFKPDRIDALLHDLGDKPRIGERPDIVIALAVKAPRERFVLEDKTVLDRAADMRHSLMRAMKQAGLAAHLTAPNSIGFDQLATASLTAQAGELALSIAPGKALLYGLLAWDDKAGSWAVDWTFDGGKGRQSWSAKGVIFDDAFRIGARGTLSLMTGHSLPY